MRSSEEARKRALSNFSEDGSIGCTIHVEKPKQIISLISSIEKSFKPMEIQGSDLGCQNAIY